MKSQRSTAAVSVSSLSVT